MPHAYHPRSQRPGQDLIEHGILFSIIILEPRTARMTHNIHGCERVAFGLEYIQAAMHNKSVLAGWHETPRKRDQKEVGTN